MRVLNFRYLVLALVVLPAGCAELFEFNLFSSLDTVRLPSLESLQSMPEGEALDYLDEELDSAAFVSALAGDAAALSDVKSYLSAAMADPSSDNGKRAAILLADLELKVYGGEELVNNIASLLLGDSQNTDFSSTTEAEEFLKTNLPHLAPPRALASRAALDAMLDGFQAAWAAYGTFAGAIDGNPDSADVPGAVNMGDVAQKALVSYMVNEALTSLYATPEEASEALWLMANGQNAASPTGTFADPFAVGSGLDVILDEAGISFA